MWHLGKVHGLWVIDPIDGTTNFANGIPSSAWPWPISSITRPRSGGFTTRHRRSLLRRPRRRRLAQRPGAARCAARPHASGRRRRRRLQAHQPPPRRRTGGAPAVLLPAQFRLQRPRWCYVAARSARRLSPRRPDVVGLRRRSPDPRRRRAALQHPGRHALTAGPAIKRSVIAAASPPV